MIVEIYEDDMMVADDQDTPLPQGSTRQTVNLYANAKVDLEAKVRYSDGSDFPGATVKLYNHAGLFGTKTADSNGEVEWSVYPSTQSGNTTTSKCTTDHRKLDRETNSALLLRVQLTQSQPQHLLQHKQVI